MARSASDIKTIQDALAEMFDILPGRKTVDATRVADIWLRELEDITAERICRACRAFIRGAAGDGKWRPELPEFRKEAASYREPAKGFLNDPQSPAQIAYEARRIWESSGVAEFEGQCEWRKFREWFLNFGPTRRRWYIEWRLWLLRVKAGRGGIPIPRPKRQQFNPHAEKFSPYRLGMPQEEILAKLKEARSCPGG